MGETIMILCEKKYYAVREVPDSYQILTVTVECEAKRRFITVELDNLDRWRSTKEYADYFRWAANEIEKMDE
jgi:hypothetical protein